MNNKIFTPRQSLEREANEIALMWLWEFKLSSIGMNTSEVVNRTWIANELTKLPDQKREAVRDSLNRNRKFFWRGSKIKPIKKIRLNCFNYDLYDYNVGLILIVCLVFCCS
ncbi:hypothetical protein [Vibrio coralliirubri]|uniref:hypothetical protein n=1 Tax=Vibrio coralliirubri TaxID=1516159 RepID=UPI000A3BD302|nr:hypothetical protein [Vibrio coralliirubri]